MMDIEGMSLSCLDYDEFGMPIPVEPVSPEDRITNPNPMSQLGENIFGYTGYQPDPISGLYYAQARYYMPEAGRFVSEDPIKSGDNWYSYCRNNPFIFFDPLGLSEVCDEDILSPEDYAIVRALDLEYEYYLALADTAAMDAIMRASASIRQKAEYLGMYNPDGYYIDPYQYHNESIIKTADVYISDYKKLNALEDVVDIIGFIAGFLGPLGKFASFIVLASKERITVADLVFKIAGNIPYGIGITIDTFNLAADVSKDTYKPNDFEVQIQIVSESRREFYINYYMIKSDGTITARYTEPQKIRVPNMGP
jgi:RHS repeat-associated protein